MGKRRLEMHCSPRRGKPNDHRTLRRAAPTAGRPTAAAVGSRGRILSPRLHAEGPGQQREADEGQHRAAHDDARDAAVVGAVALGQHGHVAGAGQRGGERDHHHLEAGQRRAQRHRRRRQHEHQQRVQEQLHQRHRQVQRHGRARVRVPAGAPQHRADGEQRHRRGGIGQHAHHHLGRAGELDAGHREQRAGGDRPGQRVAQRAAQRAPQCGARAQPRGIVHLRQRDAQRGGDEQVGQDGADHRPGGGRAEQGHQQRHAHEAGVRERGHQRAEGRVLQVHALAQA